MTLDRDWWMSRWAVVNGVSHRPHPSRLFTTLCGRPDGARFTAQCEQPETSLCGRCKAIEAQVTRRRQKQSKTGPQSLTSLGKMLDRERESRKKRQAAERSDHADRAWARGTSVRMVNGGLPTLGKR